MSTLFRIIILIWLQVFISCQLNYAYSYPTYSKKEVRTKSLLDHYANKVHALQMENISLVRKRKFNQLQQKISINLKNWIFDSATNEWVLPEPSPAGSDFVISPMNGKYYYSYNAKTNIKSAEKNHPSSTAMGDFNDTVALRVADGSNYPQLYLYFIEINNIPLVFDVENQNFLPSLNIIHSANGAEADTTTIDEGDNLYALLNDLDSNATNRLDLAYAMLDKIGDAFHQKLTAIANSYTDKAYYHIALVKLTSQGIRIAAENKTKAYEYYEFYSNYPSQNNDGTVNENSDGQRLLSVLKTNLKTLDDVGNDYFVQELLDHLTATVKCYFLEACDDFVNRFTTPKAKELWNKFVEIEGGITGNFNNSDKMDAVVKICTFIDNCNSPETANAFFEQAMYLLDSNFNSPSLFLKQLDAVGKAAHLAMYQLVYTNSYEIPTKVQIESDLSASELNATVVIPFTSEVNGGITNYEIEFNTNQTTQEMKNVLGEMGLNNSNYYYWLFPEENSLSKMAYWMDHEYFKEPPLAVTLLARFSTGGILSVYEIFKGEDIFTGEELGSLDYVFNFLDVLEIGTAAKSFIKVLTYSKGSKTINILEKSEILQILNTGLKGMNSISQGIQKGVRKLADKGLNIVYNVGEKCFKYVKDGIDQIKFYEKRVELQPSVLSTETGGSSLAKFNNGEEIYVNGTKQDGPYELFEKSDGTVGVRKMEDMDLASAFKNGFTKEQIIAIPKGNRPNPITYLKEDYIDNHLLKFENEGFASRIVSKNDYQNFGVGKPDIGRTEYVSLKSDIDNLLSLPKNEQAAALGIPVEQLEGGNLVRIDFKLSNDFKAKMPTGNEFGTNTHWIPGGKLPTGKNEAVIHTEGMQLNVNYFVIDL